MSERIRIKHGVRLNRATGELELRCDDCVRKGGGCAYWPLTEEFWDFTRLVRCRACRLEHERRQARVRYRANPAPKLAANRAYQRANQDVRTMKRKIARKIAA